MSDPCELCGERSATTGVREVKLCQTCFDTIAEGGAPQLYARFTALVESRAPAVQRWAEQRSQRRQNAERTPQHRQKRTGALVALVVLLNISGVFLFGLLITALSGGSEGMQMLGMVLMGIGVLVFLVNKPHLDRVLKESKKK